MPIGPAQTWHHAEHFFMVRVRSVVIQNFCTMSQGGCACRGGNRIQSGPERLQNLAGDNAGAGDECWSISEEAFIFMRMNVKKAYASIDNKAGWKMMADAFEDVDNILAYNVIKINDSLIILDISVFYSLEKAVVAVLLLLSFKQVGQGLRCVTAMPATSHAKHAGYITQL